MEPCTNRADFCNGRQKAAQAEGDTRLSCIFGEKPGHSPPTARTRALGTQCSAHRVVYHRAKTAQGPQLDEPEYCVPWLGPSSWEGEWPGFAKNANGACRLPPYAFWRAAR
ncbi:hypothetical protein Scep_013900 [Stephania cephalantha]|uniref:Uncharacterized protein n=1 Tax=Stephania cephalantha TaxID=152367 RepID=A0AAP0J0B5_9MAGN